MEAQDQQQGNKSMPQNPQPNDEVQLNIETVTPDTEKEVKSTNESTQKQSKNQDSDREENKDHKSAGNGNDARDQIETINP
ncbi:hypothetical protein [Pedobacter insulae]|uniref:Uncharacterized protein n=1 Tax=Pedobacter insulae TaxID=414048 RepID=A0A1I2UKP9_9SPHI|nr:hypothetical protein [Pedobacter insulae]SFG77715.1 hypothetical protein SAMN04489864_102219 [Pedobacter insulae]